MIGLKNLSCTCYINSLLQNLYYIPSIRNSILSIQGLDETTCLGRLQTVFSNLFAFNGHMHNPKDFCSNIIGYDGEPISLMQQMDVEEFLNLLFDKIENDLKDINQPNFIKEAFETRITTYFNPEGCDHVRTREATFITISVEVQGVSDLKDSVRAYMQEEVFEKDNALECEECKEKKKTVKKLAIKSLSNNVLILLKRFAFDYETFQRYKINSYFEFPEEIDFYEYSEDAQNSVTNNGSYIRKLKGLVVHLGTADSGHYYSYINTVEGKWFEFNDDVVSPFNIKDLKQQTFGGKEKNDDLEFDNIANGYLLVYEKVVDDKFTEVFPNQEVLAQKQYRANLNYSLGKYFFSEHLHSFLKNIISAKLKIDFANLDYSYIRAVKASEIKSEVYLENFLLKLVLIVGLRSKVTRTICDLHKILKALAKESTEFCLSIVNEFSSLNLFYEFFINCPKHSAQKMIIGLLNTAIIKLGFTKETENLFNIAFMFILSHVKKGGKEAKKVCVLGLLIYRFIENVPEIVEHIKNTGIELVFKLMALERETDIETIPESEFKIDFNLTDANILLAHPEQIEEKLTVFEDVHDSNNRIAKGFNYSHFLLPAYLLFIQKTKSEQDIEEFFSSEDYIACFFLCNSTIALKMFYEVAHIHIAFSKANYKKFGEEILKEVNRYDELNEFTCAMLVLLIKTENPEVNK